MNWAYTTAAQITFITCFFTEDKPMCSAKCVQIGCNASEWSEIVAFDSDSISSQGFIVFECVIEMR